LLLAEFDRKLARRFSNDFDALLDSETQHSVLFESWLVESLQERDRFGAGIQDVL